MRREMKELFSFKNREGKNREGKGKKMKEMAFLSLTAHKRGTILKVVS